MITVLYEDSDIIVAEKPAGLESQSSRGFEPDMVSQIRTHIHKLSTKQSTMSTKGSTSAPPYVGVIHRLDKPVRGVMVYAKNQKSAANLSAQIQAGKMRKIYAAVVCGKPVDNHGAYVDYLLRNGQSNTSRIVDNSVEGAKKSQLTYRVLDTRKGGKLTPENPEMELSLLDIELMTGRHHQIRVQMAGHGTPLFGDNRYGNGEAGGRAGSGADGGRPGGGAEVGRAAGGRPGSRRPLALCARQLTFAHPVTGEQLTFEIRPMGGAFALFSGN